MSGTIEELVARLGAAQKRLAALEARERPLTLRGWRDDFLGLALHEQYAAVSGGIGSGGALQNNFHGGAYRLTAGAVMWANHILWLGNAADGFATLDADIGWEMIARMAFSALTTISGLFGVFDAAGNNIIAAGVSTDLIAANWMMQTRTGGGAVNAINTGVAADTNPHIHRLIAYPIIGGLRQVDYFLDGNRIGTTTVSVPTAVLTPVVRLYALAAASRYIDLDYWGVIPMNLA